MSITLGNNGQSDPVTTMLNQCFHDFWNATHTLDTQNCEKYISCNLHGDLRLFNLQIKINDPPRLDANSASTFSCMNTPLKNKGDWTECSTITNLHSSIPIRVTVFDSLNQDYFG